MEWNIIALLNYICARLHGNGVIISPYMDARCAHGLGFGGKLEADHCYATLWRGWIFVKTVGIFIFGVRWHLKI